jgi:hypothetical protein
MYGAHQLAGRVHFIAGLSADLSGPIFLPPQRR